jgi:hypothetical protein
MTSLIWRALEKAGLAEADQPTRLASETLPRNVCTGCKRGTDGDLVPWSGQRLCWDCTDLQLDLMAKAVLEEMDIPVLTRLADIDCAWLAGHLTATEHEELLLLASRGVRVKEALR